MDIGLILAMMGGTIGVARGFVLEWGPVYWGLIGAAGGFATGFMIDLIKNLIKRKKIFTVKSRHAEVVLIVKCKEDQTRFVVNTLWENRAIGLAKTHIQTDVEHRRLSTDELDYRPAGKQTTFFSSPWT